MTAWVLWISTPNSAKGWMVLNVAFGLVTTTEALSVLKLCTPVFIFTIGSSALLGCPCCGLSIWLLLLAIFNTLFWVYAPQNFHEKTRKYSKSAIFIWYENGRWWLLGAQSINTESASEEKKPFQTTGSELCLKVDTLVSEWVSEVCFT